MPPSQTYELQTSRRLYPPSPTTAVKRVVDVKKVVEAVRFVAGQKDIRFCAKNLTLRVSTVFCGYPLIREKGPHLRMREGRMHHTENADECER